MVGEWSEQKEAGGDEEGGNRELKTKMKEKGKHEK